ncbi:hypothetical protein [Frondihabitans peucedani]
MKKTLLPTAALAIALIASAAGCTSVGPSAGSSSASADSSSPASGSGSSSAAPAAGASGASSQTKSQACTILATSMQDLSSKMTSSYAKFASNPKAAVAAIQELSDTFDANVQKVTDPGALAVATTANADLKTFVADTKAAIADPASGAAKVQKDAALIQADFTKVGRYCG